MGGRGASVLGAALVLGACATSLDAPDRASVRVLGERVTVVAPPGLCVDPRSVDVGRAGGFVLITDCALVGGAVGEALPGVLSVTVTTGGLPGTLADLQAFLTGPGLTTLGKSGEPDAISVRAQALTEEALFIKVRDTGPQPVPGAAREFWRVFFVAGPRLTQASITGFSDAAIPDRAARDLLAALVARTQAANADVASAVTEEPASG